MCYGGAQAVSPLPGITTARCWGPGSPGRCFGFPARVARGSPGRGSKHVLVMCPPRNRPESGPDHVPGWYCPTGDGFPPPEGCSWAPPGLQHAPGLYLVARRRVGRRPITCPGHISASLGPLGPKQKPVTPVNCFLWELREANLDVSRLSRQATAAIGGRVAPKRPPGPPGHEMRTAAEKGVRVPQHPPERAWAVP